MPGVVAAGHRVDQLAAAAIRECVARIPDVVVAPPEIRRVVEELLDRLLRVAAVGIPRLMGAAPLSESEIASSPACVSSRSSSVRAGTRVEFERVAYFCVDHDSNDDRLVSNSEARQT